MTEGQGGPDSPDLAALAPPSTGGAGWYRDPAPGAGAFARRYFDGERWTDQTTGTAAPAPRPAGTPAPPVAPLASPAPPAAAAPAAGATTATRPAPARPGWSAPPPSQVGVPIGKPHRSLAPWIVLGIVVVLVAVGAALFVLDPFGGSDHPSAWDPDVEPIAEEVARLRDLDFEHPVAVNHLSDEAFRKHFARSEDDENDEEIETAVRELRAVGLVTGEVDLGEAVETELQSGVAAYYSPEDEEIYVRGEELTPAVKATLAHELTHVLQDQHFDLQATGARVREDPNGSYDAFDGLVEGDAERIQEMYVAGLSAQERRAIESTEDDEADRIGEETADVPFVVSLLFGAPYAFGPPAVEVITADGGNAALDRVFEEPTFTQMIFVDPASALDEPVERTIEDPKPAKGERRVGDVESFGALDAYITLGARIDPVVAFDAASGWAGGRIATVRRGDTTCVRLALRGADAPATRRLGDAFRTWAAAHPAANPEIGVTDTRVDVVACDPGPDAGGASPDAALQVAAGVLGVHSALEASLIGSDAPVPLARCTASGALRLPEVRELLSRPEDEITPESARGVIQRSVTTAAQRCMSG